MGNYLLPLQNYFVFNGRSGRAEFWTFTLVNVLINMIILKSVGPENQIAYLFPLIIAIPSLALAVRRLHDIGKSGWWYWIVLLPVLGFF